MSERTTIGGTVYESVGSSSANLLLKCNGTARIQWGNKLIDLIKNGKIAAENSSVAISLISDKSEIGPDGIYVIATDVSSQLWIAKDGKTYNLTGTDLYISASTKQDITVEQQQQALENIGIYYNTMDELSNSGIQNGLVYVISDETLYTVKNGIITEFAAKLKTVTVEQNKEHGEVINSSVQIILSILDEDYIVLSDRRIQLNQSVYIKDTEQLGSEKADANHGYRLYMQEGISYLEVDEINVRHGIPTQEYVEIAYNALMELAVSQQLLPHQWYCVVDYQNPWKLLIANETFNRPILIRALTTSAFYEEGYLYHDRRITLRYDPWHRINIIQQRIDNLGNQILENTTTRGKIVWMRDSNGNEANFDFLDYYDSSGNPLTTLHPYTELSQIKSIFPTNSYNNKLTVYDLKGTVIKNGVIDDSNTTEIQLNAFMHDNVIECRGLAIASTCENFYGNNLSRIGNLYVDSSIINTKIKSWYSTSVDISDISFDSVEDNSIFFSSTIAAPLINVKADSIINSTIKESIVDSDFKHINNCVFNNQFVESHFKNLTNCNFVAGMIFDIECNNDIMDYTTSQQDYLLYDSSKTKEAYYEDGKLYVINTSDQTFYRGMIVMHSGIAPIPAGWAVCDGGEYTYNGITSKTPNLINRFIKAVGSSDLVSPIDNSDLNTNNEFTLQEQHLPEHSHPHKAHTHTFEGTGTDSISQTINVVTSASEKQAIVTIEGGTSGYSGDDVTSEDVSISGDIEITISGNTSSTTSEENTKTWTNKSFKIEPNYYSLIFIMKL